MDKFPRWAQPWLKGDGDQVTHGLNLALKLCNPSQLPLLLWDIVVAKPKIELAMQELSFLHYARFVPSWDASALMVTTEFDGPLEPYVMDFVIALGDVFDVLLSYVENPPPLPVREYPDEFWKYVQRWNRVPFAPAIAGGDEMSFPADFDYPVYSAYPGKTVIDITGPREKLLPPVIDHPAASVDLDDVQGNILRGYRATAAQHLFLTITDTDKARRWLADVFPGRESNGRGAWGGVMSAAPWGKKPDNTVDEPVLMANVGFTFEGLRALLPDRHGDLDKFSAAFREGAAERSALNGDVGTSDPAQWRFGRTEQAIHVMLSLYAKAEPKASPAKKAGQAKKAAVGVFGTALQALRTASEANGMQVVHTELATALPNNGVYFGYRDGIAHPRISGQCEPHEHDFQPSASPGEFLLGAGYKSIFGGSSLGRLAPDLAANGTFGVLRMLEQHVDEFDKAVNDEATRLSMDRDQLKAKLLGRWEGGEPLSLFPDVADPRTVRNDFDFAPSWEHPAALDDHEGMRCPVGAHIRRVNPRTARVAGQRHSRRLIRRGMPIAWDENGTAKKGLLGLFIGASLERQFEFIQQQWIQRGDAAGGIHGTQDPIAGIRGSDTAFPIPGVGTATVPPLITTRGCLYLFFPSISMLRGLGNAAQVSPLAALSHLSREYEATTGSQKPERDRLGAELLALPGIPDEIRKFLADLLFNRVLDSEFVHSLMKHFAPEKRSFAPATLPPAGGILPLEPGFVGNPFPAYAELRNQGRSVVWVPEHGAHWVLGRSDAERLFKEPSNFLQQPSDAKLRGIITMDEPRHKTVRKLVEEAFRAAARDVDRFVDNAIDDALGRLDGLHQFDFVAAYGSAVPRAVFWRIFGLRDEDQPACDALAQTMMQHYGQPQRPGSSDRIVFADAAVRLTGQLGLMLAKSMFSFGGGGYRGTLIGEMAVRTVPWRLTFMESLMTLVQLVLAGYMSSQFLLSTAMRNLLLADPRSKNGDVPWHKLAELNQKKDPRFEAMLQRSLEEARRVDPPVTIVERYAAYDGITVGGVVLQKGCPVFAVVASANRDSNPADRFEEFHWDRQPATEHLSLGYGIHECIGKWLQGKMVPAALGRLIEEMPELRLRDPDAMPAWFGNIYFRALQSLPVTRCR